MENIMERHNLSEIMKNAWMIKKSVGSDLSFSKALKRAWHDDKIKNFKSVIKSFEDGSIPSHIIAVVDKNPAPLAGSNLNTKGFMTLKECANIIKVLEEKTSYKYRQLRITINEKELFYTKKENSLIIWKNHLPIYRNLNGIICQDEEALADCFC